MSISVINYLIMYKVIEIIGAALFLVGLAIGGLFVIRLVPLNMVIEFIPTVVLLILFSIFCLSVASVPTWIRIYRLKRSANEFGLSFVSGYKLFWVSNDGPQYQRNTLSGEINGLIVYVYDFYDDMYINLGKGYLGRRATVLEIAGTKYYLKAPFSIFSGLSSVGEIQRTLKDLKEKGVDAAVSRDARPTQPKATMMMFLYVIISVIALLMVVSNISHG